MSLISEAGDWVPGRMNRLVVPGDGGLPGPRLA